MDRSMAYDLDGVMGTRNDGQLVSQEVPRAVVTRAPGLVEEGDQEGGGFNSNKLITSGVRRVPTGGMGEFAMTIPGVGKISFANIALGAALLFVAQRTIFSDKGKKKAKAAFAAGISS